MLGDVGFIKNSSRKVQESSVENDLLEYKWKKMPFLDTHSNRDIEAALGWSKGTLDIIIKAIRLKLSRFHVWDLGGIGSEDLIPYLEAASYFLRGVKVKTATESCNEVSKKSFSYSTKVSFIDDLANLNSLFSDAFFVVDASLCCERWNSFLPQDKMVLNNVNENLKTIHSVGKILSYWRRNGQKKNWVVIGGGVTSDITSFAASIAKIDVTIVPTTLLAMVDASVGGKCGVNFFPYGKNLIGSFYPAKQIIICKSWLETLSQREFYSGLTECLKHAFLMSSWEGIKKVSDWGVSCRVNDDKLFYKLVLFKQEVVKNDFFEQDKRVILNLGHTLGHAIETFLHQDHLEQISHGQAVAIGMVFSLVASFREGLMTCKVFDSLIRFIFSSRILQERTKIKKIFNKNIEDKSFWSVIFLLMRSDKKQVFENVNDKVSWVLLENIGQCFQEKDYKYKLDFETSYTYWLETLNILDQCG